MNWLRRLFCRHLAGATFVRNIYGDEIIHCGYNRSIWLCNRCQGIVYQAGLRADAATSAAVTAAEEAVSKGGL